MDNLFASIVAGICSELIIELIKSGAKVIKKVFGPEVPTTENAKKHSLAELVQNYENNLLSHGLTPDEAHNKAEKKRQECLKAFLNNPEELSAQLLKPNAQIECQTLYDKLLSFYVCSKGIITPDFFDIHSEIAFQHLKKEISDAITYGKSLEVVGANREETALWIGVMLCTEFDYDARDIVLVESKEIFEDYHRKLTSGEPIPFIICTANDIDDFFEGNSIFVSDFAAHPYGGGIVALPRRPVSSFHQNWLERHFDSDSIEKSGLLSLAPDWAVWKRKFITKNASAPSWTQINNTTLLCSLAIASPFSKKNIPNIAKSFQIEEGEIESFLNQDRESAIPFLREHNYHRERIYQLSSQDNWFFLTPFLSKESQHIKSFANQIILQQGPYSESLAKSFVQNLAYLYFLLDTERCSTFVRVVEEIADDFFELSEANFDFFIERRTVVSLFASVNPPAFLKSAHALEKKFYSKRPKDKYAVGYALSEVASTLQTMFWDPNFRFDAFETAVSYGDHWNRGNDNVFEHVVRSAILWWHAYYGLTVRDKRNWVEYLSQKDTDFRWKAIYSNSIFGSSDHVILSGLPYNPNLYEGEEGAKYKIEDAAELPARSYELAAKMAGSNLGRWKELFTYTRLYEYPPYVLSSFKQSLSEAADKLSQAERILLQSMIYSAFWDKVCFHRPGWSSRNDIIQKLDDLLICCGEDIRHSKIHYLFSNDLILPDFSLSDRDIQILQEKYDDGTSEQLMRLFSEEIQNQDSLWNFIEDVYSCYRNLSSSGLTHLFEFRQSIAAKLIVLSQMNLRSDSNIQRLLEIPEVDDERLLIRVLIEKKRNGSLPTDILISVFRSVISRRPEDDELVAQVCLLDDRATQESLITIVGDNAQRIYYEHQKYRQPSSDDEVEFLLNRFLYFSLWENVTMLMVRCLRQRFSSNWLACLTQAYAALLQEDQKAAANVFDDVHQTLKAHQQHLSDDDIGTMALAECLFSHDERFFTGWYFHRHPEWLAIAINHGDGDKKPTHPFHRCILHGEFSFSFSGRFGGQSLYNRFENYSSFERWIRRLSDGIASKRTPEGLDDRLGFVIASMAGSDYRFPPFIKQFVSTYRFHSEKDFVLAAVVALMNRSGMHTVDAGKSLRRISEYFANLEQEATVPLLKQIYACLRKEYLYDAQEEEN